MIANSKPWRATPETRDTTQKKSGGHNEILSLSFSPAHRLAGSSPPVQRPSDAYTVFRPVKHGFDIPATAPAILDSKTSFAKAHEEAKQISSSTGFTQVHVSGLPTDCEDDAVEAKLRHVLVDARRRAAAVQEVEPEANVDNVPDSVADVEAMPAETEAEGASSLDFADAFVSCAVVRNKDTLACKGYCFLAFTSLAQAEAAVQTLNEGVGAGVEVCGAQVEAQLSVPKAAKLKPEPAKAPPKQRDLRIGRKRYPAVSKHAQYGHENVSSGRDSGGGNTKTRNSAGRLQGVAGTRDGRPVDDDASKCSTRSGFSA